MSNSPYSSYLDLMGLSILENEGRKVVKAIKLLLFSLSVEPVGLWSSNLESI